MTKVPFLEFYYQELPLVLMNTIGGNAGLGGMAPSCSSGGGGIFRASSLTL